MFNNSNLDLFRIFDNFIMTNEFPFLQYQLIDGKMIYKFFSKEIEDDKDAIVAKWFENQPYGISFKIKATQKGGSSNKYIALSISESGRLEYKIQWKEIDKATVDDIKNTYSFVKKLFNKINTENEKLKINIPEDNDFEYAFINSIQKFVFEGKKSINHNDLSDFCRYFYPYISLVIEPRKRYSKIKSKQNKSKYGTYLRYKRVTKYENESKIEHRIIYFMKNYEYTDLSLIKVISKQFNITEKIASEKIENVKNKYPVIKKSRKILKNIENAPKYNHPGIGIDIQGRSRKNYKIRIAGARNKNQLNRIVKFMNILIYLYVDTYINKNKNRLKLKDTLKGLNNIAKRRHKVDDIIDLEDIVVKTVKKITKFDSDRLGYKPSKGESHWSRACQNSGTKKRQPQQFVYESLNDLLKKGYKYNENTGYYERKVKINKKEVILRAAELTNLKEKGNNLFYICNPEDNNEYTYVGFLSRTKNPNDLCMPCCFKKDPLESKNIEKKNYYLGCMGKLKNTNITKKMKKMQTEKIYILQDTNKIQEGRFGFLPHLLNTYLNTMQKYDVNIKNHYLINTIPSYLFKYGVKTSKFYFLEAISSIYDISVDDIKNNIINLFKKDNNKLFTSINSGDIRTSFKNKDNFINFIQNNNHIDYDIIGDLISKPGILAKNGINFYIFNRNNIIIKELLEKKKIKDDYSLLCSRLEDDLYREDENRDNIILLKDEKIYYPIFLITKNIKKEQAEITKVFKLDNNIKHILNFYKLGCNKELNLKFKEGIQYSCKYLNYLIRKINNNKLNIKYQYIDLRNKCRYIILNNNMMIPTYPCGTLYNIDIIDQVDKYILNFKKTLNNLIFLTSKININLKPIGFLYSETKKDMFKVEALLLNNFIEISVKSQFINKKEIKKMGKNLNIHNLVKINIFKENKIDKFIKNKKINKDERLINIKKLIYNKEHFELFRLELNNYLINNQNIKTKIVNILNNKMIKNKEKKKLIKLLLLKNLNKKLYEINLKGGSQSFLNIEDNEINLDNYFIKNKRDICQTNIKKDLCKSNLHCKWTSNNCKLNLSNENFFEYLNKVVEQLVKDEMKSKEILNIDNYYVSDIVNYDNFTSRKNQKIIKSDVPNINKILSEIFGEDNIPTIGKKRFYKIGKSIDDENLENPIQKVGNLYIQNVIPNNNTLIRAFSNSYYWINNKLYDNNFRNLGYYSNLQTDLSNYFRGEIIKFMLDGVNKIYINKNILPYIENINNYINTLSSKNNMYMNGLVEFSILSYKYKITMHIIDNYNNSIYILKNGNILYHKTIKKYNKKIKMTDNDIIIMLEFNVGSILPLKVQSIYMI